MITAQIIVLFGLFMCGIGHARFIKMFDIPRGIVWHINQWLPIFGGMVLTFVYAIQWYRLTWDHSIYGNSFIAVLPAIIAGVGYLIGLHYLWREL